MRTFIILTLALLAAIPLQASGKKTPGISITFHMEASSLEGKKFAIPVDTPRGKRFIQRVPTISTTDITAFRPFPSPHNPDLYGIVFQLNRNGATRFRALSGQNVGKWMVASINGRVVDMMLIDKPVDGRVVTVWRNVDPAIIQVCDKKFPRIGEDPKKWKERIKKAAKARKK